MSHYAHRDPISLEPHYSAHVSAMTSEGLHAKSAIAAELAFRDALVPAERERVLRLIEAAVEHRSIPVAAFIRAAVRGIREGSP